MLKVYAVLDTWHDYRTEKIFATKELAEKYIATKYFDFEYEIEEFEVIECSMATLFGTL